MDMCVEQTHELRQGMRSNERPMRYTDTRVDEQARFWRPAAVRVCPQRAALCSAPLPALKLAPNKLQPTPHLLPSGALASVALSPAGARHLAQGGAHEPRHGGRQRQELPAEPARHARCALLWPPTSFPQSRSLACLPPRWLLACVPAAALLTVRALLTALLLLVLPSCCTAGHVNFSDELCASLRLADGMLLVVDAVEGCAAAALLQCRAARALALAWPWATRRRQTSTQTSTC